MATATRRKPTRKRKSPQELETHTCAFCGGSGRDPYEILSKLSTCQVCGGRKTVEVEKPAVACASCHGTGKQRHTRLTCSACKGTGFVKLDPGPTTQCPQCGGSGRMAGADLPCSLCKGAGLVAKESGNPRRATRK